MPLLTQTIFHPSTTISHRHPGIACTPTRLSNPRHLCLLLSLLASLWLGAMVPSQSEATETVVHRENSLYQYLLVLEDKEKNERYLVNREKTTLYQGGVKLDTPDQLLFEYSRISFLGLAYLKQLPKDALFIGMGIGAMPRFMAKHFPENTIEIVEIDPAVVNIAKEYFSFKELGQMTVKVEDGRQFIKRSKKGYDIVFLDAYQGETIPFHLTTREFLQEVKARLNPGGVVVSNILSPKKNKFFTSMVKTYNAEFVNLSIYKGKESSNYVFVASGQAVTPEVVWNRAKDIQDGRRLGIDLAAINQDQLVSSLPEENAEILTDDFAPVNLYQHMEEGQP
ncbi:MAG: fused MFS/spermidine synthase [Desulfobulbaceae bacterium]|nr:fused MFS/spermidine synthase [Desulfobulbaceae bacterium]